MELNSVEVVAEAMANLSQGQADVTKMPAPEGSIQITKRIWLIYHAAPMGNVLDGWSPDVIAPLLATLLAGAVFNGDIGDATYCFLLMQMELVMSDCYESEADV